VRFGRAVTVGSPPVQVHRFPEMFQGVLTDRAVFLTWMKPKTSRARPRKTSPSFLENKKARHQDFLVPCLLLFSQSPPRFVTTIVSKPLRHKSLVLGQLEWAHEDLNLGPHPYQGCALAN